MRPIILFSILTLALAACGEEGAGSGEPAGAPAHDMSSHEVGATVDHGEGTIVSVDQDGRRLGIEHGPLEAVGMGAMTMIFETTRDVELADVQAGDEVTFMVKQGRDGSWRITQLCPAGSEGDACRASMQH